MPHTRSHATPASLAVSLLTLFGLATSVSAFPLLTKDFRIEDLGFAADRSAVAADFSGDGITDLAVFSGVNGGYYGVLSVIGGTNGAWSVLQLNAIDDMVVLKRPMRLLLWEKPGGNAVVAITRAISTSPIPSNELACLVLEGWPLRVVRRFPITEGITGAAVGDVDSDGRTEIVFSYRNGVTTAIDAIDGAVKWTLANAGEDLALAQLDIDNGLEVIISGPQGGVYDGATRAQEFTIPTGFGDELIAGRFGLSGVPQFATLVGQRLTGFGGMPLTPQWEFFPSGLDRYAAADVNGDGQDELLSGPIDFNGPGSVVAFDTVTQQGRILINTPSYELTAMGTADFTGDGQAEGFISGWMPASSVKFFDLASSNVLFDAPGGEPIYGMAAGDADDDGFSDLVLGSRSVRLIDRRTGATKWTFSGTAFGFPGPEALYGRFIRVVDANASSGQEVVVAGDYDGGAAVQILNGKTGALLREITEFQGAVSRTDLGGIALSDINGDSLPELFMLTHSSFSDRPGPILRAFSLTSGQELWGSAELAASRTVGRGVEVVPPSGGLQNALIVAATGTGLTAFDAATFALAWSLPWPEQIRSFAVVQHPQFGAEIVIAGETGRVAHISPTDRSERLSYSLPTPITSVADVPQSSNLAFIAGGKLRLISSTGEELDASQSIGPSVGPSDMLSISERQGKTDIVAASILAVAGFQFDPNAIFIDGFHAADH